MKRTSYDPMNDREEVWSEPLRDCFRYSIKQANAEAAKRTAMTWLVTFTGILVIGGVALYQRADVVADALQWRGMV